MGATTVVGVPVECGGGDGVEERHGSLAGSFAELLPPLIQYRAGPCVTFYSIILKKGDKGTTKEWGTPMSAAVATIGVSSCMHMLSCLPQEVGWLKCDD